MDSDDDDDDYTFFGTPLPDLDEDAVVRKKAVQDLTVRDEQGRQRFHGAFTGGFSAGYFNTVGTKEGWVPSSFVSSRTKKAASNSFQQNPEDFMDNEDFGEFGIAPKTIRATSTFHDPSVDNFRKRKQVIDVDAVIPGEPPLKDLVRPVMESIGILILKKMGWRQGQGIGPRVKNKEGVKVYGCSLGPLVPQESGIAIESVTFAPDETPEFQYVLKDDCHGLGYSGLSMHSVLGSPEECSVQTTKTWLKKEKKKLKISGQAFGIGALEDDDDEDVYTRDDMSQYDFSEGAVQKSQERTEGPSGMKQKPVYKVLEGFCEAERPFSSKKRYSVPEVPRDFVPRYKKKIMPTFEPCQHSNEITRHKLNPVVRSLMLGEKSFVKPVASTSGERKSRFCEAVDLDSPMFPPGLIGNLSAKPFSANEDKQNRYNEFVQSGCSKDHLSLIQPSSMTEWEKQQELDEFIKTSSLYRPFSNSLKSRFESRSQLAMDPVAIKTKKKELTDDAKSSKVVKIVTRETFEWHPASLLCRRFNVPNPYPDSKFEGIPHSQNKKSSLFDFMFSKQDVGRKPRWDVTEQIMSSDKETGATEVTEEALEKKEAIPVETAAEVTEIQAGKPLSASEDNKKPPMDLFKEIFQSSSSEDSGNSDDEIHERDSIHKETVALKINHLEKESGNAYVAKVEAVMPTTVPVSKKEAFGVFANLDLDALNKRVPASDKSCDYPVKNSCSTLSTGQNPCTSEDSQNRTTSEDVTKDNLNSSTSSDCYGPELPPGGIEVLASTVPASTWVAHKHSRHKHHKHKEKKKKKKKKHSRKDYSSLSSDSAEEEVSSELILKKLRELQRLKRNHKR